MQTICTQCIKRGLRRRLDRIGDSDHAGSAALQRYKDRGGSLLSHGLRLAIETSCVDVQLRHQHRVAERDLAAAYDSNRALTAGRGKVAGTAQLQAALA